MALIQRLRFPRTRDSEMLYLAKIRVKYPPPPYDPRRDGSWNPADGIFDWLFRKKKKKLRKLCKRHALEHRGSKVKLVKRLYLHWRAKKLGLGNPQVGYGPGYECVDIPTCSCGVISRKSLMEAEKRKEEIKEQAREIRKYVLSPTIHYFPRYRKDRIHWPRLDD